MINGEYQFYQQGEALQEILKIWKIYYSFCIKLEENGIITSKKDKKMILSLENVYTISTISNFQKMKVHGRKISILLYFAQHVWKVKLFHKIPLSEVENAFNFDQHIHFS